MPTIRLENTFNPNISFTKIKGQHTIRFGTNIVRRQIIDYQLNQGDGLFSFSPAFTTDPNNAGRTGDSMASFLLGTSSGVSQDFLLVWPGLRAIEIGSFLHDDWKVSARLTLNIGLRYEYTPPPVEVNNQWATLDLQAGKLLLAGVNSDRQVGVKNDGNNWAPRFCFASQLRPHAVIRGGFGIFYDDLGVVTATVNQTGFSQSTDMTTSFDNGQTYAANLTNPFPGGFVAPPGSTGGLATSLGQGITFFDGAGIAGGVDELLAEGLADCREDVLLSTKVHLGPELLPFGSLRLANQASAWLARSRWSSPDEPRNRRVRKRASSLPSMRHRTPPRTRDCDRAPLPAAAMPRKACSKRGPFRRRRSRRE